MSERDNIIPVNSLNILCEISMQQASSEIDLNSDFTYYFGLYLEKEEASPGSSSWKCECCVCHGWNVMSVVGGSLAIVGMVKDKLLNVILHTTHFC